MEKLVSGLVDANILRLGLMMGFHVCMTDRREFRDLASAFYESLSVFSMYTIPLLYN